MLTTEGSDVTVTPTGAATVARIGAADGSSATDAQLVAAIRAGNERVFEAVYDRYARALLSYCRHMLGSLHEAEDALQQTFLKAYRALRSTEKPIKLRPWLYAIARNECISLLRRRDARSVSFDEVEIATEGLAATVEQREELRAMLVDISRLPEEQREALILTSAGTLSGEEIAGLLGCDRNRVKSLVFSARQALATTRESRDTSCADIRRQLSVLRGAALRRRVLREHLVRCESCRSFRYEVRRQRQLVASVLPVIPAAGLKALCVPGVSSAAAAGLSGQAAVASVGTGLGGGGAGGAGIAAKASAVAGGSAASLGILTAGDGSGTIVAKGLLAMIGIVTALVGGGKLVDRSQDGNAEDRAAGGAVASVGDEGVGAAPVAETGVRSWSEGSPIGSVRVVLPIRGEAGRGKKRADRSSSATGKARRGKGRGRKPGSRSRGEGVKYPDGRGRSQGRGAGGAAPGSGPATGSTPHPGGTGGRSGSTSGPPPQVGRAGPGPSAQGSGPSGASQSSQGAPPGRPARVGHGGALGGNSARGGPPAHAGGGPGGAPGPAKRSG